MHSPRAKIMLTLSISPQIMKTMATQKKRKRPMETKDKDNKLIPDFSSLELMILHTIFKHMAIKNQHEMRIKILTKKSKKKNYNKSSN